MPPVPNWSIAVPHGPAVRIFVAGGQGACGRALLRLQQREAAAVGAAAGPAGSQRIEYLCGVSSIGAAHAAIAAVAGKAEDGGGRHMLKPIPYKEWPSLHTVRQAHEVAPISGFTAHFVDRAALVA